MKEKIKKQLFSVKKLRWQNFIMLLIAGCVNAFGVTAFLAPVKLFDSGISGTAMLLDRVAPEFLTLSFFLIVLNVPLFLYGLKKQGVVFTIYSLFTVCIYSIASYLITYVLPIDVSIASPLAEKDLLLCAIFGGVLSGIGSGMTIRYGGSLDGIEVMAVIFAKKLNISVGTFVMIFNAILYVVAGIVIGSWILPLYSVITYFVGMKTVDFIAEGIDRAKSVMIITDKAEEVNEALIDSFGSGSTIISAKGGYSNANKTIIYFVVNRFQISKMRSIILAVDPFAYVTISDVADVIKYNKSSEQKAKEEIDIENQIEDKNIHN